MPKVPILMPQLGDSIAEATVLRLLAAQGDTVEADQEIFEVETNKATMGVTTMCGGILSDVFIKEGESVVVGACMAMIEATEEEIERSGATPAGDSTQPSLPASPESVPQAAPSAPPREEKPAGVHFGVTGESYQENGTDLKVQPSVRGLPVPAGMKGAHYMSPRMKARMDELGMSASDIAFISGSGAGGRVTIDDLEEFLEYVSQWPHRKASSMRLAVADAMRRSWTRPGVPYSWTPSSSTGKIPRCGPASPCTLPAPWPWPWRKARNAPATWWGKTFFLPKQSTSASPPRWRTASWFPCCAA